MYQHLIISFAIASTPLTASPSVTDAGLPVSMSAAYSAPSGQQPPPPPPPAKADTKKPATAGAAKGVRTVEIVGTDDMKFSVTDIAAKPGEQLRVRLVSKGTMPKIAMAHNFVLLQKDASTVKFVTAGAQFRDQDFIAPELKGQVLAKTTLAGPGETVEVTFKVPAAAGAYPFICSFPGHFQAGMKGTLTVK
jgi:azurin